MRASILFTLASVAAIHLGSGCSSPATRDCFSRAPSQLVLEAPKPPPLTTPPASVADVVELQVVASGLKQPVAVAQPPGDTQRLFVIERGGRVLIVRDGADPVVFADFSDRVATDDRERGLLGIAFHPEWMADERLYVNYTAAGDGATHVVEFRPRSDNPDAVDPASARQIVRIGQPWPDNNGGHLAFGPDGLLYVGTGDGGGRDDPRGHAQQCDSWRGKMLRVAVSANKLGEESVQVSQIGLRNPWRYSFDRRTGDLYIADVGADSGADAWELLYAVSGANLLGHNFGWNIAAGSRCHLRPDCDRRGFTAPIFEYDHAGGCAIIGGYVYRGQAIPELDGAYFFADFCSAALRSIRWQDRQVSDYWDWRPALDPAGQVERIVSFGEDQSGELYLVSLTGTVYKLRRK